MKKVSAVKKITITTVVVDYSSQPRLYSREGCSHMETWSGNQHRWLIVLYTVVEGDCNEDDQEEYNYKDIMAWNYL
jgi:hypothetical protein